MPRNADQFDASSVRREWDSAADIYTAGQTSGRDVYRYAFFGPAQIALCGDVRGVPLLDVGCGNGYFSRAMAARGARVTAFDISERMIEHARIEESGSPLGIDYRVADASTLGSLFGPASFDMVTSCLSLQDMPDVPHVLEGIRHVLAPGGRVIASVTHPCSDTPFRQWERTAAGAKRWLCIDRYFDRGALSYDWSGWPGGAFTTTALHAPLEDWFSWILSSGFHIRGFHEPKPTAEAVAAHPELADAARVPYFLFFDLVAT